MPAQVADPPLAWSRPGPAATGALFGLTAVLIWGSYLAMARSGVVAGWSGADIALFRYIPAGLVLLPWLLRHRPTSLAGIGWRRGAVLAALAGPGFILAGVGGYAFAPLAHGAVLQPAVVALGSVALAAWLLGERPGRRRLAGIGGILAGLCLVAGPGLLAGEAQALIGDAMFLLAGLMWAGFGVLSRRWGAGAVAGAAAVSVLSAVVYLPAYLMFVGPSKLLAANLSDILVQVAVQGVLAGVVAVIAYTRAVQLLGAASAAILPALVPVVAIATGIPLAGEWPAAHQVAGLGVVTLGLLIVMGVLRRPR